jgi:anthranilate phosphoribosyltransferase
MSIQYFTEKVMNGKHLTRVEMNHAAAQIFDQIASADETKQFLIALHQKGEVVDEIVGLVDVVMKHKISLQAGNAHYFDNCGTGGDQLNTFNISTTTAFVLAGCGIPIAKHGNRKISSQSGSSDVLEALGIDIIQTPEQIAEQLSTLQIAFLHAPNFHPKLGSLREIRSEIPHATIFNLIGPLCNPAPLHSQIVGINRAELLESYAEALHLLGRNRAIVISGADGLDEASLHGVTQYATVQNGDIKMHTISPEQLGFERITLNAIKGGSAQQNADILVDVLSNKQSAYFDTVLLNTAFGLIAHGVTSNFEKALQLARNSITSGKAIAKLRALQQFHLKEGIAK